MGKSFSREEAYISVEKYGSNRVKRAGIRPVRRVAGRNNRGIAIAAMWVPPH